VVFKRWRELRTVALSLAAIGLIGYAVHDLNTQLTAQEQKTTQVRKVLTNTKKEVRNTKGDYRSLADRFLNSQSELGKTRGDYRSLADRLKKQKEDNQRLRKQLISRGEKRSSKKRARATIAGGSLPPWRIINCESGGSYTKKNPNSSASGRYQFIDSTWRAVTGLPGSARDYPPSVQDEAARKLWNGGKGASNWECK
jgi:uncharacterized coiled-coil protein SlyX